MKFTGMPPKKLAWITFGTLFFLIIFTYVLRPISEPDFFWHLKTGEWIWQNKSLPTIDPFTFTATQSPSPSQIFILQGYPLAQLTYYSLYENFGWTGIYILRIILAGAFFLVFMLRFSLSGCIQHSWLVVCGLFSLFSAFFLEYFPLDRPQVFSFLYFGILLLLYDWIATRGYKKPLIIVVVPTLVLLAIWGNTHGGSFPGLAILSVIAFAEAILLLLRRRSRRQALALGCFVAAGTIGCFLNNTSLDPSFFISILTAKTQKIAMYNNEYFSVLEYFKIFQRGVVPIFIGFFVIVIILICTTSRAEKLGEIFILITVGTYSCISVRYMPFFFVIGIPFVYDRLNNVNVPVIIKYLVAGVGVILFSWSISDELDNGLSLKKHGAVSNQYPVAATNFIVASDLHGNIFNPYQWGGYLIWRLAPERKIFQDSRALDEQVVMDGMSTMINLRRSTGKQMWQEIMDKYNINIAIIPRYSEYNKRQIHKLFHEMSTSSQWITLFNDETAIVFRRAY